LPAETTTLPTVVCCPADTTGAAVGGSALADVTLGSVGTVKVAEEPAGSPTLVLSEPGSPTDDSAEPLAEDDCTGSCELAVLV